MQATVLVAVGGALGSVGRYWAGYWMARLVGEAFPWGTLAINVVGSVAIGAIAAATGGSGRVPADEALRLLLMVGVCGGFTTFSSFSLQTLALLQAGQTGPAFANVAASVMLCVAGTAGGMMLFTRL